MVGGVTHCQKDDLHVMHAQTFSFPNGVLGYKPPAGATRGERGAR